MDSESEACGSDDSTAGSDGEVHDEEGSQSQDEALHATDPCTEDGLSDIDGGDDHRTLSNRSRSYRPAARRHANSSSRHVRPAAEDVFRGLQERSRKRRQSQSSSNSSGLFADETMISPDNKRRKQ